jgi:hypothetical protein
MTFLVGLVWGLLSFGIFFVVRAYEAESINAAVGLALVWPLIVSLLLIALCAAACVACIAAPFFGLYLIIYAARGKRVRVQVPAASKEAAE